MTRAGINELAGVEVRATKSCSRVLQNSIPQTRQDYSTPSFYFSARIIHRVYGRRVHTSNVEFKRVSSLVREKFRLIKADLIYGRIRTNPVELEKE